MTGNQLTVRSGLAITGVIAVATVLLSLGFVGWLGHGSAILLSMAETGLSWCF